MPKYTAHCCPICKGKGEITEELAQTGVKAKYQLATGNIYTCHVCMGVCFMWHTEISEAEARGEKEPEQTQVVPHQLTPLLPNIIPGTIGIAPYQPPTFPNGDCNGISPIIYTSSGSDTTKLSINGKDVDVKQMYSSWSTNCPSVRQ